jgi:hypothetical protein
MACFHCMGNLCKLVCHLTYIKDMFVDEFAFSELIHCSFFLHCNLLGAGDDACSAALAVLQRCCGNDHLDLAALSPQDSRQTTKQKLALFVKCWNNSDIAADNLLLMVYEQSKGIQHPCSAAIDTLFTISISGLMTVCPQQLILATLMSLMTVTHY